MKACCKAIDLFGSRELLEAHIVSNHGAEELRAFHAGKDKQEKSAASAAAGSKSAAAGSKDGGVSGKEGAPSAAAAGSKDGKEENKGAASAAAGSKDGGVSGKERAPSAAAAGSKDGKEDNKGAASAAAGSKDGRASGKEGASKDGVASVDKAMAGHKNACAVEFAMDKLAGDVLSDKAKYKPVGKEVMPSGSAKIANNEDKPARDVQVSLTSAKRASGTRQSTGRKAKKVAPPPTMTAEEIKRREEAETARVNALWAKAARAEKRAELRQKIKEEGDDEEEQEEEEENDDGWSDDLGAGDPDSSPKSDDGGAAGSYFYEDETPEWVGGVDRSEDEM